MDESESKKENRNGEIRRFSQEQYDMLKRCSDKKDMTEWNEWRDANEHIDVELDGAGLSKFYLKNANLGIEKLFRGVNPKVYLRKAKFNYSNLEKVDFERADLKEAIFVHVNLEGANLSSSYLQKVKFIDVHLENANLIFAHLDSTFLLGVHLEGASLRCAKLHNTNFCNAHLDKTDFVDSELPGSEFDNACLIGAKFRKARVNGSTSFCFCDVDRETDFREVGLGNVQIDPATRQLLECNIRRMNWEEWYEGHPKLKWLVKPFWWMSDYGLSTGRIIVTFFALTFVFANIYYHWGRIAPPGIVENLFVDRNGIVVPSWLVPLRTLYFSIVTMTTLGFGDMYANAQSIWGHILLSLQVILGYVLLGALVTRFAVLFTAGGPAGKFADEKKIEPQRTQRNTEIKNN
jgi:uncharacterized protein YjbI with pentapeptide repeats